MDDLLFGTRDKRGNWTPKDRLEPAPLFAFPPRPAALLKWLPGYFLPWNIVFAVSAWLFSQFLLPDTQTMKVLDWPWILQIFATNCIAVFLFYGGFELKLYIRRTQEGRFKYNPKFPSDHQNSAFLFNRQNVDSLIRAFGSGVPIWTAYEVCILHLFATGTIPSVSFEGHPYYLFFLFLVLPLFHEVHFYVIHRLIHIPLLYKWVHSVHHNSVNPSPWSSLSMHPVEHLAYFSIALIHLILPSNPVLAIYQLHFSGFGAVVGHVGFDRIEFGESHSVPSHAYAHYLHHKYFEVNYADGLIPFDRWFGTWHDGTKTGDQLMQARYEKLKARMNAESGQKNEG